MKIPNRRICDTVLKHLGRTRSHKGRNPDPKINHKGKYGKEKMSQAEILAKLFEATSHEEIDQLVSNLNRDMINAEGTKILRFIIFRAEEEKAYKCRKLLEAGACPNDSGCEGSLLLEAASRFKKCPVMQEIAELLKQHGATNPSSSCCDCDSDSDSDDCCGKCYAADCCGTKTITVVDCSSYGCTTTDM